MAILYRPQGNGRAEAAVRLVVQMLRQTLFDLPPPTSWITALPWATYLLNIKPGVVHPHSPYSIVFGREPIGPGDLPSDQRFHRSDDCDAWVHNMNAMRTTISHQLNAIHDKLRSHYERKHPFPTFRPGDSVWIRRAPSEGDKLDPLWYGPCEILLHIEAAKYRVALPHGPENVHVDDIETLCSTIIGQINTLPLLQTTRSTT